MAAGLSQTQLANLSDVNRTDEVAGRLAKALRCTIADIREEDPNES